MVYNLVYSTWLWAFCQPCSLVHQVYTIAINLLIRKAETYFELAESFIRWYSMVDRHGEAKMWEEESCILYVCVSFVELSVWKC